MIRSSKKKLLLAVAVAIIGLVTYSTYSVIATWRQIPNAYAAWDTGTLLVEYLKAHDNQWPKSWDDLLTVMEGKTEQDFILRGRGSLDRQYAVSLREKVFIDWSFNPQTDKQSLPVRRLDGKPFPVTWQGADPNDMIRHHLASQPKTKPD